MHFLRCCNAVALPKMNALVRGNFCTAVIAFLNSRGAPVQWGKIAEPPACSEWSKKGAAPDVHVAWQSHEYVGAQHCLQGAMNCCALSSVEK